MLFLFASVSAWLLQAADADEDEARYRLSPEMVARYRRDGFVVLKGVFNGDGLNAVRPGKLTAKDREALSGDHALQKAVVLGNPETDEDPNTVIKLEGVRRLQSAATCSTMRGVDVQGLVDLCESSTLESIAKQLMGSSAELMKDKFIFKPAGGGGGFPPHQDMTFIYSRVCTDAVNFGIAFDKADAENGALEVAPGLEARIHGTHVLPTTETKMEDAVVSHLDFVHVKTEPGDCVVFSAWLLHRSSANQNPTRDRSVYYVTYGIKGDLKEGPETTDATCSVDGVSLMQRRQPESLYDAYYELYDAWINAGYPRGSAVDSLLGPSRPRPSLIPPTAMGVQPPTNRA